MTEPTYPRSDLPGLNPHYVLGRQDLLVAALVKAQQSIEQPLKNAENPAFKSGGKAMQFANLGACLDSIRKPLNDNGLQLVQTVDGAFLVSTLWHVSGQSISSSYPLPIKPESTPQAIGGMITYARRYAICAMFCLFAEADDDAQAATQEANNDRAAFLAKMNTAKAASAPAK